MNVNGNGAGCNFYPHRVMLILLILDIAFGFAVTFFKFIKYFVAYLLLND